MAQRSKKTNRQVSVSDLNKLSYWLFPILVVVVIVTTLGIFAVPTVLGLFDLQSSIEKTTEEVEVTTKKLNELQSQNSSELDSYLETLSRAIPEEKPVKDILNVVAIYANLEGLVLESYDLNPGLLATSSAELAELEIDTPDLGELGKIPLELTLDGSNEQFFRFVERLEKLAPIIEIEEMAISYRDAAINLEDQVIATPSASIDSDEIGVAPVSTTITLSILHLPRKEYDQAVSAPFAPVSQKAIATINELQVLEGLDTLTEEELAVASQSAIEIDEVLDEANSPFQF